MRSVFLSLLAFAALTQGRGQGPVELAAGCGDTQSVCVPMTVDAPAASLRVAQTQDSLGFTTFELSVYGRLADAAPASQTVRLRGYTDGLECSSFGQAEVGVLGHSADGHPIVATNAGPFEVIDTLLRVGCPECARVRELRSGRLVATRRTPGWDLTLAGTRADSLWAGPNAELVITTRGEIIQLTGAGRFRRLPSPSRARELRLELEQGAC